MNILFYGFRHGHILGCYHQAQQHPDCRIVGALEEYTPAREKAEAALGVTFDQGSYESWLEKPEVEAVAIGGVFADRGPAIIKALQHGKHVISDKPLCTTLEQLEQIRTLAQQKNLKVGCLLDLRYIPAALRVKALMESCRLGQVRNVTFTGQHCLDYGKRDAWYFEPGRQGGTINDIAIHGVDLLPFMLGHSITKVHSARTWNAYAWKHPHFLDCATFMAELDNGAGVLADVSYAAPHQPLPTYWNFQIWCDRGLVTFRCGSTEVTVYADGEKAPEVLPGIAPESTLLDDFLKEIRTGSTDFTHSVLASTETTLRIQQAADARN